MRIQAFEGLWRIERSIGDARAGLAGRFAGRARFAPVAGGLDYLEEGELRLGGAPPMAASRRYLWREGEGGAIELFFPEGGFFHRFDAEDPTPAAAHDCPPDRYEVRYDFRRWPRWSAAWRVRGPRKDTRIFTTFLPLDSGPGLRHERA